METNEDQKTPFKNPMTVESEVFFGMKEQLANLTLEKAELVKKIGNLENNTIPSLNREINSLKDKIITVFEDSQKKINQMLLSIEGERRELTSGLDAIKQFKWQSESLKSVIEDVERLLKNSNPDSVNNHYYSIFGHRRDKKEDK